MAASFDLVTLDCREPRVLAGFWGGALQFVVSEDEDNGRWIVLSDPHGVRRIGLQRVDAPRIGAGAVHLDLRCQPDEFGAEVDRLCAIGAVLTAPVRTEAYGRIANFTDPDGHLFDLCAYE